MLIRFNVKNFLSFNTRDNNQSEEFSMIAGKVRNKPEHLYIDKNIKLLKFAAVYGANAAGKSNLVKAMQFMKTVVLYGLPDGHTEKYCRINKKNKNSSSYFEFEILLDGKYYAYGFEVILSQSKFISEWLVELHANGEDTLLFQRDIASGLYEFGSILKKDKNIINRLNIYAEDIKKDETVLFLNIMNKNKGNLYDNYVSIRILRDLFRWISYNLDINSPKQPVTDYYNLAKMYKPEKIYRTIAAFGTGVTDLKTIKIDLNKALNLLPKHVQEDVLSKIEKCKIKAKKIGFGNHVLIFRVSTSFLLINIDSLGNTKCETIKFGHGQEKVLFSLNEESDGTIRLIDLLEILIAGEGKTYIVDELDRCLHPSLTYKFVETFLKIAREKNIQLIVTTHEARLMDFELLRRDEIWFVQKKENGTSDIYSLEEYNTRFDKKIDKAYLEGRYGGIPIFSTIFPVKE